MVARSPSPRRSSSCNRQSPLIDLRWLFSREMLHFAAVLVLFRLMLAEQTAVAGNFFQITGLQNDQLAGLYGMVLRSPPPRAAFSVRPS
jgi:hypothetical protein